LLEHVVPLLRDFGVEEDALDAMLVRTPARLLAAPVE
jgi:predicted metal-dependent phosphotriesterase family hydrolase